MRLKRTDFMPHPAVDTVLVELKQRSELLIPEDRLSKYRKFVADCFHSPELFARAKGSDNPHNEPLKPSQLTADEWQRLFMKQR